MKTTSQIDGWFNHQETYDFLLANMPKEGTFVELGAWLGKSSSYLCDKATTQKIVIVDSFKGTAEYLDSYYNLAKTKEGTFVELGAWLGKSSSYLCDKATTQKIVIVDSFKGTAEYLDSYYNLAKTKDIFKLFIENMGERKYKAIKATSETASKKFKNESLDVVFIDLDHSYDAVKLDIQLWLPKIKKGGFIAGDDYHPNWNGVIQAVDELLPHAKFIDDCWLYQK